MKTIINFDLPKKITEYNNRIGRTARIGHQGRAISFYDPDTDWPIVKRLCQVLGTVSHSTCYIVVNFSIKHYITEKSSASKPFMPTRTTLQRKPVRVNFVEFLCETRKRQCKAAYSGVSKGRSYLQAQFDL